MAETWTYGVYWGLGVNAQIPDNPSIPVTIKRLDNTGKDGSFYKLASSTGTFVSNCNVKTWSTGGLAVGSYGQTSTIGANSSNHTLNLSFTNISSSILNVGSSAVSTTLTETSSSQTIYIYGTQASPAFTITVQVTDKYSASTFSVGDVNFGATSTVNFSNTYISDLKHRVVWTVGGQTSSVETSTGATSASITIPSAWMSEVPNSTYITASVQVTTYKGSTQIGSASTKTFTVNVPSNVVPSIGSITCSIKDPNAGMAGKYIQNTTGVYIQMNNVSAGTGATLQTTITFSCNVQESATYDSGNKKITINKLANSGTITFSVSIKDSRGRQSNVATASISVVAYALPAITVASAYRCRQSGIADENGTYASIRIVANYSTSGGNTMTINSTYFRTEQPGSQTTAQNNMSSGVSYIIGNGNLSPSLSYSVRFTVTDSLGNVITKDVRVQTSAFAIHVKNGGTGVAFGKTSEVQNSVEINDGWDLYYKGLVVNPVIYKASLNSVTNPFEGLICLIPKS